MNNILGLLVNVQIVNLFGIPIQIHVHHGRFFVEGVHKAEYRLSIGNRLYGTRTSSTRLEVLTAIDGRDTLLNAPADPFTQRGMVISGPEYLVKGWRINDEETRPFEFNMIDAQTVAVQTTGSVANLGVIEIQVYSEYVAPPRPHYHESLSLGLGDESVAKGGLESFGSSTPRSMRSADDRPGGAVGTGIGRRIDIDVVGKTTFTRSGKSGEPEKITIYVKSHKWLVENGVIQTGRSNDFPSPLNNSGETGYGNLR